MELIFPPEKNSIFFIWKVFTVTFEEMSLLNKSVKFLKKKKYDPKLLIACVCANSVNNICTNTFPLRFHLVNEYI